MWALLELFLEFLISKEWKGSSSYSEFKGIWLFLRISCENMPFALLQDSFTLHPHRYSKFNLQMFVESFGSCGIEKNALKAFITECLKSEVSSIQHFSIS